MHSIVKRLYNGGIERLRAEVESDSGCEGELRFGSVSMVPTAILIEQDDEFMRPLIPSLERAELVAMHVDMMKFRGIERDKSGAGYEQEWSVRIIGY